MLAGVRPFAGDEPADRMTAILRETPRSLRGIGRQTSTTLERVVGRLLERDTTARYGSADELLRDLTREQTAQDRAIASPLRPPRVRLLALAGVAAVLFGGTSVWWKSAWNSDGAKSIAVL